MCLMISLTFIDAEGRVDINKLPTMAYGDDVILTREGALQTRVLIHNIAGTIWDEARNVTMKDGQGIDSGTNLEVMVDGIKSLARLRKKTVNMLGTRLADEAMQIKPLACSSLSSRLRAARLSMRLRSTPTTPQTLSIRPWMRWSQASGLVILSASVRLSVLHSSWN